MLVLHMPDAGFTDFQHNSIIAFPVPHTSSKTRICQLKVEWSFYHQIICGQQNELSGDRTSSVANHSHLRCACQSSLWHVLTGAPEASWQMLLV